jgi:hypothetical protein
MRRNSHTHAAQSVPVLLYTYITKNYCLLLLVAGYFKRAAKSEKLLKCIEEEDLFAEEMNKSKREIDILHDISGDFTRSPASLQWPWFLSGDAERCKIPTAFKTGPPPPPAAACNSYELSEPALVS